MQYTKKTIINLKLLGLFIILSAIILPTQAAALGVSPGRVEFDFVPKNEFSMTACFSQFTTQHLHVEAVGWVKDHIKIVKGLDKDWNLDTQTNPCVEYEITLPDHFENPGIQYGGLVATEVPDELVGNIYAVISIMHQIYAKVPYPGKYIQLSMNFENSPAGNNVPITLNIENKGDETIDSAVTNIKIYDFKDNLIQTLYSDNLVGIKSNEQRIIQMSWNSSPNKQGNYHAKAVIDYDGQNTNATTTFKLGGLDMHMLNYSSEIVLGGIERFSVLAESIWSEAIPNARANIIIYQNDSDKIAQEFETLTKAVSPWSMVELPGYIDTKALGLGEYDAIINLSFAESYNTYPVKIKIIEAPKPEAEKKSLTSSLFTTRNIVIVMVILLVIILLLAVKELAFKKKPEASQPPKAQDASKDDSTKR